MSNILEKNANNEAVMTIVISLAEFEEGMKHSYNKNRGSINMPGFRRGKVPRQLIEAQYGKEIFYDDAIEFVFPKAFGKACEEIDETVVSRPRIDDFSVDGDGVTLKVLVTLKPAATVYKYKGFTYEQVFNAVTEDEITAEIDKDREKNARIITVTDRPVETGDKAVIDFEGFIDNVAFPGGEGKDHELEIGSHSFIDNFEDQLIGKSVGEHVVVNVTFPADYHAEQFAGKPARFEVDIKEIKKKELPSVDDEFAQDVSEFDTLDEYKKDIREKLLKRKEEDSNREKEDKILEKLIDELECDIPPVMIENQIENRINDFRRRIESQGMKLEQYLQYMGQTPDSFREMQRVPAEKNVKLRLCLEEVAKMEGIAISDEDFDAEIAKIAESYRIEASKLKDVMSIKDFEDIKMDMKVQRAIELVVDSAVAE